MRRALELAAKAEHRTSPNPMVGAVVLDKEGRVAGEGFHQRAGEAHAEPIALEAAGERARGGTLYVTLEPCPHQGRTPPCVSAVIAAGVARVVIALEDPDSKARGAGVAALRAAGIAVEVGVEAAAATRLNEFYVKHRTVGLPFVTAKFAMSLDGKIATAGGESRWISGDAARAEAHRMRRAHDAILVGVNTVLMDDPELTARGEAGARQPLRVVVDSTLKTPATAQVAGPNTLIATTSAASKKQASLLVEARADVQTLPAAGGGVDLAALLEALAARGVLSVLAEGGGEVLGDLFDRGLVDKVVAFIAPSVIGGRGAPIAVAGQGVEVLAKAARVVEVEVRLVGDDIMVSGYVQRHR